MGTPQKPSQGFIHIPLLLVLVVLVGGVVWAVNNGRALINQEQPEVQGAAALPRETVDRADEVSGSQVHVMYVLPSDGADQSLDSNGSIATSVAAFQKWLRNQTGGKGLKLDTSGGALDVTFFRMGKTDEEIKATGANVVGEIQTAIIDAGLTQPDKIYSVYYGGGSTYACGGAAWPPTVPGITAAMYLLACPTSSLTTSEDNPGYWEYAMLHDTFHVLGIVPTCAPNHTLAGHVSDSSNDLMYAGPEGRGAGWFPSILDKNNDDYFRNEKSASCPDLSNSPYMEAGAVPQPTPSPTPTPTPAPLPPEPTVSIASPTDGSVVDAGSTVTIKALASDDKGVIKVEFRVNASRKCTVTSPSASGYLCDWKVVGKIGATYSLEARAYDADGHQTNSTVVKVTSQ